MKKSRNTLNKTTSFLFKLFSVDTSRLVLTVLSMTMAATSVAAEQVKVKQVSSNSTIAYVDSIHQWGAWELDIEPAAGGLQAQSTQPLNARNSKVALRTNSISALAPPGRPAVPAIPATPAVPATPNTPAIPAIPATPAITPISPSVPIPVGGPNDGF
jgi:hypothetical protein